MNALKKLSAVSQCVLVGVILASASAVYGQMTTINFNSTGELGSNFTTSFGSPTEVTSGGVGGSGAFTASSGSFGVVGISGVTFTVGSALVSSISFKATAFGVNGSPSNTTGVYAGFSTNSTSPTSGGASYSRGYYSTNGSPNIGVDTNWLGLGLDGYGAGFTLSANNWYKLESSVTKSSTTGQFTYSVYLYDLGVTGESAASLIGGSSNTHTTSSTAGLTFYNATTLFPFFQFSANGNSGVPTVDNLSYGTSAIPEPSTYAVIAGALTLGLAVWRRRVASKRC